MKVVCKKNKNVNSVAFALIVFDGAISEPKNKAGITHLIEHLCFTKAGCKNSSDLSKFCEKRGVFIRAQTGKDHLYFSFVVRKSFFQDIILLFSEMFHELNYTAQEVDCEKKVILAEKYNKLPSNDDILIDSLWSDKRLKCDILGNEDSLNAINLTDIVKRKKEIFESQGVCLLIGNYTNSDYELVRASFEREEKNSIAYKDAINSFETGVKFIVDEYDECTIYYALKIGISEETRLKQIILLQMLNSILFQGDTAAISSKLREKGFLYEINSRVEISGSEAVLLFTVNIHKKCLNSFIKELELLLNNFCVTEDHLSFIRAFFCDNLDLLFDNFNDYMQQCIDNCIYFKRPLSPEEVAAKISKYSLEDYQKLYDEILRNKNVFIFGNIMARQKKEIKSLIK